MQMNTECCKPTGLLVSLNAGGTFALYTRICRVIGIGTTSSLDKTHTPLDVGLLAMPTSSPASLTHL